MPLVSCFTSWKLYKASGLRLFSPVVRDRDQFLTNSATLTHLMPLVSFDTPWKHQKTSGFLMFLRDIEGILVWNGLIIMLFTVKNTVIRWNCSIFALIVKNLITGYCILFWTDNFLFTSRFFIMKLSVIIVFLQILNFHSKCDDKYGSCIC